MDPPLPTEKMDVTAFERWLEGREGRYELDEGRVVAMAAERVAHALVKMAAVNALSAAARGLPCQAFPDGMAVRIGEYTQREPDAALRCGAPLDLDATFYTDPVVIIEVTSPSTATTDASTKLADYARIGSLAHYLIVDVGRRLVIHQRRVAHGYDTTLLPGGTVRLDPPGLTLDLDAILAPLD